MSMAKKTTKNYTLKTPSVEMQTDKRQTEIQTQIGSQSEQQQLADLQPSPGGFSQLCPNSL